MTFRYEPGKSLAHRLDPRSKLAFQASFAITALAYTTPRGLLALTGITAAVLVISRTPPIRTAKSVRFVIPFLIAVPVLEGLTIEAPWFVVENAASPALASFRIMLVLFVTAGLVRTTSVRETRAAVQWLVPGKPGQFLGMGASFVVRFLPVLRNDLRRVRTAQRARLGSTRPTRDRIQSLVGMTLRNAFRRSDRFALALQARCFSWNPTLPTLRFSRLDGPVLLAAGLLTLAAALSIV